MAKRKISELVVALTANTAQFQREMVRVEKQLNRTGSRFQRIGTNLSRSLAIPLLGVGIAAGVMTAKFDDSLSKIVGLVGVAENQVAGFRNEILKLAPAVAKGPAELADAMFFITSAGFRGAEAMDVLTRSAKASTAGLGVTKVIADAVTSAVNAYGISVLNATNATDILTAAVRAGKLEAESLSPVLGSILPIAANLGVQFGEVAGAIAAMSKIGLNAAESAEKLKALLFAIQKPADAAQVAIENTGLTFDFLRKTLREKGLLALLNLLRITFQGNEKVLARVFPKVQGLIGLLSLIGANAKDVANVITDVSSSVGEVDRAFSVAAKTSMFRFKKLLAEINVSLIRLGTDILPIVLPVLDKISILITKANKVFSELDKRTKSLAIGIAVLLAVMGPLVLAFGFFLQAAGNIFSLLISLKLLPKILLDISRSLIAMTIAGIKLPILALSAGKLNKAFMALRATTFSTILPIIAMAAGTVVLIGAWDDLKFAAVSAFDTISKSAESLKTKLTSIFTTIRETTLGVFKDLIVGASVLSKVLGNLFGLPEVKTAFENVKKSITPMFGVLAEGAKTAGTSVADNFSKGLAKISDFTKRLIPSFDKLFSSFAEKSKTLSDSVSQSNEKIKTSVDGVAGSIKKASFAFTSASDAVKKAMEELGISVATRSITISQQLDILRKASGKMREDIVGNLAGVINKMKSLKEQTAGAIGDMVGQLAAGKASFGDFVKFAIQQIVMLIAKIAVLKTAASGMSQAFGLGLVGGLGGIFGGLFAEGGRPPLGRVSVVGEKGPELFVPDTRGTVIPTNQLALAGGGGVQNNSFSINMNINVSDLNSGERNRLLGQLADDIRRKIPNALKFSLITNDALNSNRGRAA